MAIGKFNFKDDDINEMIQQFYAIMESVLQSSKFDNLNLDDPFDLKIRLLERQHMQVIRDKQKKYLKRLNLPNYGLDNLFGTETKNAKVQIKIYNESLFAT